MYVEGGSPRGTSEFSGHSFKKQGSPNSQGAVIKTSLLSSPQPEPCLPPALLGSFVFVSVFHVSHVLSSSKKPSAKEQQALEEFQGLH